MSMFRKGPEHVPHDEDLVSGIRRERIEREVSDIEKRAERAESYERTQKKRRKFTIRLYLVMAVVLVALTLAVAVVCYRLLFVVDDIVVQGNVTIPENAVSEDSGVVPGILLYSFRSSVAERKLIEAQPTVKSLSVHRVIPSTVILTVECEEPKYYTGIFGKQYFISESLRVIGEVPEGYDLENLIKLKLPGIKDVKLGEVPSFRDPLADKQFASVTEILSQSELNGRVNMIDLRDLFRFSMVCDGKYLIEFGDYSSVDAKLLIASSVLKDAMFEAGNRAKIDVSDLRKTSVVVDNTINLD